MEGDSSGLDLEKKLQHQLIDARVKLLSPPYFIDHFLAALNVPTSRDTVTSPLPCKGIPRSNLLPKNNHFILAIVFKKPVIPHQGKSLDNFITYQFLKDLGPATMPEPSILP
ncbi:hypothetical protein ACH5RR_008292 [Cinchona calisaya]|uniref:Uncharacterized protein n=1 Tax=Cinchona calisaya TaxID=153742 RepID=A0ABD3AEL2_9GENT